MDTLTHSLVGLTAAKAGLEKLSPGTTVMCVVAANAPDLDFLVGFFGDRWTVLDHHRAITHSILGVFLLALLIPALFCLGDVIISRLRHRAVTLRFRGLLLASLMVSATHPLMDWTNNYGIRLLLPWSGRWFYGDLVFIIDPFLWLILGGTAFLLTSSLRWQLYVWSLLAAILTFLVVYAGVIRRALDHPAVVLAPWLALVIGLAIFRKRARRWGRQIAVTGLVLVVAYWAGLGFLHWRAVNRARVEAAALTRSNGEQVMRMAAMPTLANPTHWQCVVESNRATYRFELFLLNSSSEVDKLQRFPKPDETDAKIIALAARERPARILLEFARFPVERVVDRDCLTQTLVEFADLRYTEPGKTRGAFSLEVPIECPNRR
jgi:inner membrane protein